VGALIFRRDRVLLVERGRDPLKGYWSLPGGLVETGERLEEAVAREVLEETGLRVKPAGIFEVFERIMRDESGRTEYHYVLVDYVCRVMGGRRAGKLRAGDDVSKVEWAALKKLDGYRITEGTVDVIERASKRVARSVRTGHRKAAAH
jgi:8-oxo-dGTP diphosphatase